MTFLKNRRKRLGLTQTQVAKELGMSRPTYTKYEEENGVNLYVSQGKKLAVLFGMPYMELFNAILGIEEKKCHACGQKIPTN